MTKRVLSMLMALIMALSLCVPAFAADEPVSADEPAAEVEAPAAEAEETEAVDEAETVAVDEPAEVVFTDQEKIDALNTAVAEAKAEQAQIEAHVKQQKTPGNDEALEKAIEKAEGIQAKIKGQANVAETEINAVIKEMADLIADLTTETRTGQTLKTGATATDSTAGNLKGVLGDNSTYISAWTAWDGTSKGMAAMKLEKFYPQSYIDALTAAVQGAEAFNKLSNKDKTYAAYYQAYKALEDLKVGSTTEVAAKKPTTANATTLQELIEEADAIAKAAATGGEYVNDTTAGGKMKALLDALGTENTNAATHGTGAKGLLYGNHSNTFAADVDYDDWYNAVEALQDAMDDLLVRAELVTIAREFKYDKSQTKLTVTVKYTPATGKGDDYTYVLKAAKDDGEETIVTVNEATDDLKAYADSKGVSAAIGTAGTQSAEIESVAATVKVVHLTLYRKDLAGGKDVKVDSFDIRLDGYTGPLLADDVKYDITDGKVKGKLTVAPNAEINGVTYTGATVTLLNDNGTEVKDSNDDPITAKVTSNTDYTLDTSKVTLTAGTYRVRLDVDHDSTTDYGVDEKTFTIGMLDAYLHTDGKDVDEILEGYTGEYDLTSFKAYFTTGKKGVAWLEAIATAAKNIDNVIATSASKETTEEALALLEKDIAAAEAIVAAAGSTLDTKENRDKVDAAYEAIVECLGFLEDGVDTSDLEDLIAEAEALVEADYTPESWYNNGKGIESALAEAKKFIKENKGKKSETAEGVNCTKCEEALEAAMNALKVVKVDLTALEEAIAAAEEALDETKTYTEESKKAYDDALAAAKALTHLDDPTQSAVDAAIAALEAAVAGLTEAGDEPITPPEDPELEEGWNLIEGEYYYCKDGKMVKSDWVKSKGLWYHMGADGTMDTGFIHIVDDWGDGWYYLEPSNDKGTEGRMRTGWQDIDDASAGPYGWFETRSNGHQGQCTYTKGWGDFDGYIKK